MQYELYIDLFFLVNFVMDYFLFCVMRYMLKSPVTSTRIVIASSLSSLVMSTLICFQIPETIKGILLHFCIPFLVLKITFQMSRREMLKGWILMYLISALMEGVVQLLFQSLGIAPRSFWVFTAVTIVAYYMVLGMTEFMDIFWRTKTKEYKAVLQYHGRKENVKALNDTGNMLYDNISGCPVHVISSKAIKKFSNEEIRVLRYIPYCTVQGNTQVMPLIKLDRIYIHGKKVRIIEQPYVAISECKDFGSGVYDLILHSDCMREDGNDDKNSS